VATIPPRALRNIIGAAQEALPALEDPIDPQLRRELGVIDLRPAIAQLHRPEELSETFLARRSPAHRRVIMQEFFTLQLALRIRRATEEVQTKKRTIAIDDDIRAEVRRILPFKLTRAQKRVLKEIADDLRRPKPMSR